MFQVGVVGNITTLSALDQFHSQAIDVDLALYGGNITVNRNYEDTATRIRNFNKPYLITAGPRDWTTLDELQLFRSRLVSGLGINQRNSYCLDRLNAYVENSIHVRNNILFASIHLLETDTALLSPATFPTDPEQILRIGEAILRLNAAVVWLRNAFDIAECQRCRGIVILSNATNVTSTLVGRLRSNRGLSNFPVVVDDFLATMTSLIGTYSGKVLHITTPASGRFEIAKTILRGSGQVESKYTRVNLPSSDWIRIEIRPDYHEVFIIKFGEAINQTNFDFQFGHFGCNRYVLSQREPFEYMLQDINKTDIRFIVNVGDAAASQAVYPSPSFLPSFSTQSMVEYRDEVSKLRHPYLFTPGDNDWSDYRLSQFQPSAVPFLDPLEILQRVRQYLVPPLNNPPFNVVSQPQEQPQFAPYIENKRWIIDGIVFITLHLVGENDALGEFNSPDLYAEQAIRMQANISWLNRAYEIALQQGAKGLVIFAHAAIAWANPTGPFNSAFAPIAARMNEITLASPNLMFYYLHADIHRYVVTRPFLDAGVERRNFVDIQNAGTPSTGWTQHFVYRNTGRNVVVPNWGYFPYNDNGIRQHF